MHGTYDDDGIRASGVSSLLKDLIALRGQHRMEFRPPRKRFFRDARALVRDRRRRLFLTQCGVVITVCSVLAGCSQEDDPQPVLPDPPQEEAESAIDYEGMNEREKAFIEAALPFYEALAEGEYEVAYRYLSRHATSPVRGQQFALEGRVNPVVFQPMSKRDFRSQMEAMLQLLGEPRELESLEIQTTDPQTLAGEWDRSDPANQLEVIYALGSIPASTPINIRRASLRGRIRCELTPSQIEHIKRADGGANESLDEYLETDSPYYTVKTVLVEDNGVLQIGYFEFLGPSIFQ